MEVRRLNKVSQFGTVARVSNMPGQTKEAGSERARERKRERATGTQGEREGGRAEAKWQAAWYRNKKVKVDFIDAGMP